MSVVMMLRSLLVAVAVLCLLAQPAMATSKSKKKRCMADSAGKQITRFVVLSSHLQ